MKASEAMRFADVVAKHLDHDDNSEAMAFIDAARAALREKAEREEQERKKVTLKQMAEACSYASGLACGPHVEWLDLAAATLRYLAEGGGGLLKAQDQADRGSVGPSTLAYAQFLRSLGVEPKP